MQRFTRALVVVAVIVAVVMPLAACKPKTADPDKTDGKPSEVKVGSMLDAEGSILGQMVIALLESDGIKVVDKTKLGTPEVCRQAIEEGEIDVTIDYTGSGQYYHEDLAALDVWNDADKAYASIYKADAEKNDLYWLKPAPANNTEMLCTTKDVADQYGIASLEDFARYVKGGGAVKLVCSQSFADNPKGLKGIEKAYGFTLEQGQLIAKADGNTAAMLNDLAKGTDGINFSLAYGTDGQLDDLGLVTLADPKSVPPVYEPAPVVRGEVLKAYPRIKDLLEPVFDSLTLETLRGLNKRVAFGGEDPKAVAEEYLTTNGFLE